MHCRSLLALLALSVPVTVSACEGECIVQITNAYVGNYTTPVDTVMHGLAQRVSQMLPSHPDIPTATSYLEPLLSAYDDAAYMGMETAIFPRYFHGKCQQNGVDPPGCPNPDCPVVCGTPGSMVHFFPTLRFLAYNETRARIEAAAAPDSGAYKQVEQNVLDAANEHWRRESLGRIVPRAPSKTKLSVKPSMTPKVYGYKTAPVSPGPGSSPSAPGAGAGSVPQAASETAPDDHIFVPVIARSGVMDDLSEADLDQLSELNPVGPGQLIPRAPSKATSIKTTTTHALAPTASAPTASMPVAPDDHIFVPVFARADSEQDIKNQLQSILAQASTMLGEACADDGSGVSADNLAQCSWETAMKEYILTFP